MCVASPKQKEKENGMSEKTICGEDTCGECRECDTPEGYEPALKCCEFCTYSKPSKDPNTPLVRHCTAHEFFTHSLYKCDDFDPGVWYSEGMPEVEK
jgi:hypothetical protein